MGLKLAGARLLRKGGLLNRTNYIAAMRSATIEFADTWYGREAIVLADWSRTNAGLAENTAALDFERPTANADFAPSHWAMYTAETGGTLLAVQALDGTPAAPALGASFGFDAGRLEIMVSAGAVTGLGMKKAYESGIVQDTTYLAITQRQPSGGNPGQIDTREAIASATWVEDAAMQHTVRNSAAVDFGIQLTDVAQPMWVGLYTLGAGGDLLWEDQIDVTPDDPDAGASISVPVNRLRLGFVVDA